MCNECFEDKNPMRLIADVDFEEDTVAVPRDEYAELIAESTILRVVERMVESDKISAYYLRDALMDVLSLRNIEEFPAKTPPKDDADDASVEEEDSE